LYLATKTVGSQFGKFDKKIATANASIGNLREQRGAASQKLSRHRTVLGQAQQRHTDARAAQTVSFNKLYSGPRD